MDKDAQIIMTVGKDVLFASDYFSGFTPADKVNFEQRILDSHIYMRRGLAERDINFKQPIAYQIIVNPETKQIFTYKRASDDSYKEDRLKGKWTWGVGGHIEKVDGNDGNQIYNSMLRELEEEVEIKGSIKPRVLGYINYDDDTVSKVHFCILYLIETDATEVIPRDSEIKEGRLRPFGEVERILLSDDYDVETWSEIAFGPIKKLFED